MDAAIAEYREAVQAIALRVSRGAVATDLGVHVDDLEQEGLIDVWQSLMRGVTPSADMIENRMRDWVRHEAAQLGRGRNGEPIAYDALLPLDDFRGIEAQRG
jgi:hypothetical protein